jgi:hypothetical protein
LISQSRGLGDVYKRQLAKSLKQFSSGMAQNNITQIQENVRSILVY